MKKDLLEKIKSRGYWRVNFQPLVIGNIEKIQLAKEVVEKNAVELRGWDYPHIPRRGDDDGKMQPCGDYYEGWEDWACFKEFWRIYKSEQFLYYRGLREDWLAEDDWRKVLSEKIKTGTVLAVLGSSIYEITEIFTFLSRLAQHDLYKEGVKVTLSLHNLANRELWIDDESRFPFSIPKKTGAEKFFFSEKFTKDDLLINSMIIANSVILKLFDHFEWNPSSGQIMTDQEKLLSGRL